MATRKTEIKLKAAVDAEYDSPGGQRITVTIPAGTRMFVPSEWIYGGFDDEWDVR